MTTARRIREVFRISRRHNVFICTQDSQRVANRRRLSYHTIQWGEEYKSTRLEISNELAAAATAAACGRKSWGGHVEKTGADGMCSPGLINNKFLKVPRCARRRVSWNANGAPLVWRLKAAYAYACRCLMPGGGGVFRQAAGGRLEQLLAHCSQIHRNLQGSVCVCARVCECVGVLVCVYVVWVRYQPRHGVGSTDSPSAWPYRDLSRYSLNGPSHSLVKWLMQAGKELEIRANACDCV